MRQAGRRITLVSFGCAAAGVFGAATAATPRSGVDQGARAGSGAAAEAAVAARSSASPLIHVINFRVKNDLGKSESVPNGGTYDGCPGVRIATQIEARYRASGMSSRMRVTTIWKRDRKTVYAKTEAWGTPSNGVWAYEIHGSIVAENGVYTVRFLLRQRVLGKGSVQVACGAIVG